MKKFKNTSRRKIQIVYGGKTYTIPPRGEVVGPDFFKKYKGLKEVPRTHGDYLEETLIPEPTIETIEVTDAPVVVPTVKQDDEPSLEITVEEVISEEKMVERVQQASELIEYHVLKKGTRMRRPKRIDLSDHTFIIPVCLESEDRRNNLVLVIDFLLKYFDTNVIICESDKSIKVKDCWKPEWGSKVKCLFVENKTGYFYKTKLLNHMIRQSKTPYVVSYDSDVLLKPHHYVAAAEALRNGTYDFCYPFDRPLKHIEKKNFREIRETLDLDAIDHLTSVIHQGIPPGGCFYINKEKFIEAGMENENFISWGPEDAERLERLKILGYKVGSLEGQLYHVDHIVTQNSTYTNPLYAHNLREFEKVKSMTKDQLRSYVGGWKWNK